MIVLAVLSWWYSVGWAKMTKRAVGRVDGVLAFFSFGTLFRSLFAPFRQISAGRVQGPMNVQMQAFFDRTFSRFVGAFMRSFMIFIGFFGALFTGLFGLAQVILWPLVPLSPIIGLILALTGWSL